MSKILTTCSKKTDLGGLHYTVNHTGKMSGLHSLSTAITANPRCIERQKNKDSICSKCFAAAMLKRYTTMSKCLEENSRILSGSILPGSVIPQIPVKYFRFEAFADLINENHVINFFNIAAANPETLCALWTKNPDIIAKAIKLGYNKPQNLQIILSSPLINKPIKSTKYDFIDKIFTVYNKEGAKDININCGARSCLGCGRCYRSNPEGVKLQHVSELLK